jgi:anti-sigma factor RsiW
MSEEEHCRAGKHGHSHNITCREVSEFLLAYLDRELDEAAHTEFEQHLQLCPPCEHYLHGYRDTIALVRACTKAGEADGTSAPGCSTQQSSRPRQAPPEDLIQAILSAKCRATKPPSE